MSSKSTQTTTRTPYNVGAVNSANDTLAGANTASQATLARYSPALNDALGGIQSRMEKPPAYLTDARSQLDKTINGDYLNPSTNPYEAGIADLIAKKTQGQYNATYGASGRSNGGMAALLSGQGVGDALQSFYANNYNAERGNQMQAMGAAPGFHQDENTDAQSLFNGVSGLANLPLGLARQYGQGVTEVNQPYTTDTTTTKQSMGLGSIIGAGLSLAGAAIPGIGPIASAGLGAAGSMASGMGAPTAMGTIATSPLNPSAGVPSFGGYAPTSNGGFAGLIAGRGNPSSMGTIATNGMRFLG